MNAKQLTQMGVPEGATRAAVRAVALAAQGGLRKKALKAQIEAVIAAPDRFVEDAIFGELARALEASAALRRRLDGHAPPAPYQVWGADIDGGAIAQMEAACRLPIAARGALMPDAHMCYGLPIGGVLATRGAVVPYAVGVDIACRMRLSVLDMPPEALDDTPAPLVEALEAETRLGLGARFAKPRQHAVMDEDWSFSSITAHVKDLAYQQLGTTGSGNHFVEFGVLTLPQPDLGLAAGRYLALLSHSGSRGPGGKVAKHFSDLAMKIRPGLPKALKHLAWLDMDSEAGQAYWAAMMLMGRFSAANHALIHEHVAAHLKAPILAHVENHHNFAWHEVHDGEALIVHRKGATPAGAGVLGIIPGSMGAPGYLVRGLGASASLASASHGAGRAMSRNEARARFSWREIRAHLDAHQVTLLSGDVDEAPMAYKDIEAVMDAQADLVTRVGRFDPRLVKMAPAE
ncbi:RtcB family protein [Myxococcota bacterium]|nr:RtcB family protein [Myxococcota bacterium]